MLSIQGKALLSSLENGPSSLICQALLPYWKTRTKDLRLAYLPLALNYPTYYLTLPCPSRTRSIPVLLC